MKRNINSSKSSLIKNILWLFLWLCTPALSQSQHGGESKLYNFSLKQAIDYALGNKDSVLNARLDEKIASQKIREYTARGLPQINGNAEFDMYYAKPVTIIPGGFGAFTGHPGADATISFVKTFSTTIGASASQLLFDGSFFVGLEAIKNSSATIIIFNQTNGHRIGSVSF